MKKLILIGGGGHCKSCIDVIEGTGEFEIVGILDKPQKEAESVLGYPIIGTDEDINTYAQMDYSFLITIGHLGDPSLRIILFNKVKSAGGVLPVIKAIDSYCSKYAKIEAGSIIMHQAIVNADAVIGENCIINNKALIEHDVYIESNCHISTGAIINGGVVVGRGSFIGSGAVIKQYSKIPEKSFIKANSIFK